MGRGVHGHCDLLPLPPVQAGASHRHQLPRRPLLVHSGMFQTPQATLLLLLLHAFLPKGKLRPADKLQLKAATILPLVGLARTKQDPINRGHGAQYLYRPPPGYITSNQSQTSGMRVKGKGAVFWCQRCPVVMPRVLQPMQGRRNHTSACCACPCLSSTSTHS